MALKAPTIVELGPHVLLVKYTGLTTTDTCKAFSLPEHSDRSVHIGGNFSGSASMAIHGSNDDLESGANLAYAAVKDADGTAITGKVAAFVNTIRDITLFTKPVLTSGDGSADIDVHILCRRNRP